jgi:hypothetical protein
MAGDHSTALKYLNLIFQMEVGSLREDIQGYSQLMFLMAHLDAGNDHIMEYLIKGAKQFFNKMEEKNKLQTATLKFFQKITQAPVSERKKILKEFDNELVAMESDIFERRSILYLDIRAWIARKI